MRQSLPGFGSAGWTLAAFVCAVFAGGCASPPVGPWIESEPLRAVTLSPGDEIEVRFRYWPELDETVTIRPDGKIALQLIDEVDAAGLSPEGLDARLTKLYEAQLKDPVLTVMVRGLFNQRIYVGGEVNEPGVIEFPERITVSEAIMEAGGFNLDSAKLDSVILIRFVNGRRYVKKVNLKPLLKGEMTEPVYLAERDIVYVPETRITKANRWVDQYINLLLPDIIENAANGFLINN